jgi:hypothetical protein
LVSRFRFFCRKRRCRLVSRRLRRRMFRSLSRLPISSNLRKRRPV